MENPPIPSDYEIIEILGTGSFATVWKVEEIHTKKQYAMKIIPNDAGNKDPNFIERLNNEISICRQLHHPNICSVFDICTENNCTYLIEELCLNGTLGDLMIKKGQIPEDELRIYFFEIAKGLHYLHEEANVIHRDIKIDNIMFDANNCLKIIDFGLSTKFNPRINEKFHKVCGSPKYVAPEMFFGYEYDSKIDIWAFGIVIFFCACGYFPFESYQLDKLAFKIEFEEPIFPLGISDELIDLIKKMLQKDPDDRIGWNEIFNHIWLKEDVAQSQSVFVRTPIPLPEKDELNSVRNMHSFVKNEEFVGSIYVTHRSRSKIKRSSSISFHGNQEKNTIKKKKRRLSKINESLDSFTTIVNVMNSHLCESEPIRKK